MNDWIGLDPKHRDRRAGAQAARVLGAFTSTFIPRPARSSVRARHEYTAEGWVSEVELKASWNSAMPPPSLVSPWKPIL
jgi:hypothetical protein